MTYSTEIKLHIPNYILSTLCSVAIEKGYYFENGEIDFSASLVSLVNGHVPAPSRSEIDEYCRVTSNNEANKVL